MTDQPDDPYASPPPGWQPPAPPPPPPPYGVPPVQYDVPTPPPAPAYGVPPAPYGAPPPPPYGAPPGQYGAPSGYAPPPYGAPYGQHAPGYAPSGYPPPSSTNGFAIASLACSIVLFVVVGIGSVLGVVFGIIGLRHCRANNERGRGLAIAGIVIGGIGIAFWVLAAIGLAVDGGSSSSSNPGIGAHAAVQLAPGWSKAA